MLDLIYRCILFFIKFITFLIAHITLLLPKSLFKILLPFSIKLVLWSISFNIPIITDKRIQKDDKNIPIIVYQHSTFADHYILLYIFNSVKYVIFDKHRSSNIIVKKFTDLFGCIPVVENTKSGAAKKIQDYVNEGDYKIKLAIAPEGGRSISDDGNEVLAPFSSGAFVPLAPIQPVTIQFKYKEKWDNPTWNSDYANKNIASWYFWRFFTTPIDIHITLLEEAFANKNMTPKDYCEDIRIKMTYEITKNINVLNIKKNETILKEVIIEKEEPELFTEDIKEQTEISTENINDKEG